MCQWWTTDAVHPLVEGLLTDQHQSLVQGALRGWTGETWLEECEAMLHLEMID